jgi:hypothetical protein
MKRLLFLALGLLLTACGFVGPRATVQVTPPSPIIGTGETQTLTASLSSGTAEDFTWTIRSGDGQLSSIRGSSVTYTAPDAVGEYTITVSALGVEATNAVVRINVLKKFIASNDASIVLNPTQPDRSLTSGQTKRFIVEIPPQLTEPHLVFELGTSDADDTAITMVVKNANQEVIGTSNNPRFFSRSAASASALEAQAITVTQICRGACVIIRNPQGAGRYFLELTSNRDISAFDLFLFDDPVGDGLEPNDTTCTQATTVPNSTFEGAIETLGDIDCFQTTANSPSITLSTTPQQAITIQAQIRVVGTDELLGIITIEPGGQNQVFTIDPPRPVKVLVTSLNQAGPNNSSRYGLNIVLN